MNTHTVSKAELARIALQKAMKVSADLVTKSRHFAAEQIANGGITALGFHSKFVKKPTKAVFAFLGGNLAVAASAIQEIDRQNAEAAKSLNEVFATGATLGNLSDFSIATEFVADKVYEALHNLEPVKEFNRHMDLVEKAYDPDFEGPLPRELADFNSGRTYGPLAYEFAAHANLEKHGIKCLKTDADSCFVFNPKIVEELNRQHNITEDTNIGTKHHVLVFKLSADARPQMNVTSMRWNTPEAQPVAGAAPVPAYIPN